MLQSFANHLIGTQQVVGRYALAVWRIGHQNALVLRLHEVLEVLLFNGDVVGETSGLDVQTGGVDSLDVHVVTVDVVVELALLGIVIVNLVEQLRIEVRPLLEGIFLAEQTGCHVAGNQCSLDEQCARAAHGVDKVCLAMPARHQDHTCCQHLVEWCLDRLLTVAATMQRVATGVKTQRTLVFGNVDVQADIRIGDADVWTLSGLLAELVNDGILYLVGYKLRMAEFLRENDRVDSKGLVDSDIFAPVKILNALIDIISRQCLKMLDGFQDADGSVQLEIGAIQ